MKTSLLLSSIALFLGLLCGCSAPTVLVTPNSARIIASVDNPFNKLHEVYPVGNSDVLVLRDRDDDSLTLTRYNDTLGVRWEQRLPFTAEQSHYAVSSAISVLFDNDVCTLLYGVDEGPDSIAFMGVRYNMNTGRFLEQRKVITLNNVIQYSHMLITEFGYKVSSDSSKLLVYRHNYTNVFDRDTGKYLMTEMCMIDSKLQATKLDTMNVRIRDDIGSPYNVITPDKLHVFRVLRDFELSGNGLVYQVSLQDTSVVEVILYDLLTKNKRVLRYKLDLGEKDFLKCKKEERFDTRYNTVSRIDRNGNVSVLIIRNWDYSSVWSSKSEYLDRIEWMEMLTFDFKANTVHATQYSDLTEGRMPMLDAIDKSDRRNYDLDWASLNRSNGNVGLFFQYSDGSLNNFGDVYFVTFDSTGTAKNGRHIPCKYAEGDYYKSKGFSIHLENEMIQMLLMNNMNTKSFREISYNTNTKEYQETDLATLGDKTWIPVDEICWVSRHSAVFLARTAKAAKLARLYRLVW